MTFKLRCSNFCLLHNLELICKVKKELSEVYCVGFNVICIFTDCNAVCTHHHHHQDRVVMNDRCVILPWPRRVDASQ